VEGRANAAGPQNQASGRKVRPVHDGHDVVDAQIGIVQIQTAGINDLAQIVGRDVGCHANRDTAGPIDQQVRVLGRQNHRLIDAFIVVGLEIDGFPVDILDQRMGGLGHACFGVTHGRGTIPVHGAEIALSVDQLQTHGEVLRHPNHRVINRGVTMGMVLTHDLAHDTGGFSIGPVVLKSGLFHRVKNTTMHGFEAVPHIRQRTGNNHAHGVI